MQFIERFNFTLTIIRFGIIFLVGLLIFFANKAAAQQMVVDDAEITTHRSFQIESWYGTIESWMLPAVGVTSYLEVAAGLGFDSDNTFSPDLWMLEAKVVPGDLEDDGSAWGIVTGVMWDMDREMDELYAYIPYSRMMLNDSSVLHLNAGWAMFGGDETEHALIYGIRADIGLYDRISVLSELFTENVETPSFQAGLRFELIDGLLEMDVTYGQGFQSGIDDPGLNIGLAFTPDRMW